MKKKLMLIILGLSFVAGLVLSLPSAKPLTHEVKIFHDECTGCGQCEGYAGSRCITIVDGKAYFIDNNCDANFIVEITGPVTALCSDCEETEEFMDSCPLGCIRYNE